jgi:hypothetical protein
MEGFTKEDVWEPVKLLEYLDGMGIVDASTYSDVDITRTIQGSAVEPKILNRVLMRGTRYVMKWKHNWGYRLTWGGFATKFTERYLRRYYKQTIFFDRDELSPIFDKIRNRFWMHSKTFATYEKHFLPRGVNQRYRINDEFSIVFKGKVLFMDYEQYRMCLLIFKQSERLKKLEKIKDEQAKRD